MCLSRYFAYSLSSSDNNPERYLILSLFNDKDDIYIADIINPWGRQFSGIFCKEGKTEVKRFEEVDLPTPLISIWIHISPDVQFGVEM